MRSGGSSDALHKCRILARFALTAVSLALPSVAQAQLAHFEFKRIKPTDTLAVHRAEFSKCDKFYNAQGCSPKDMELGGIIMSDFVILFADDGSGVPQIDGHFDKSSFERMLGAFKIKWGMPAFTKIDVEQNGYGAKFEVETVRWDFVEGFMLLRSNDSTGFYPGMAEMEYQSIAEKARQDALEAPKVDF